MPHKLGIIAVYHGSHSHGGTADFQRYENKRGGAGPSAADRLNPNPDWRSSCVVMETAMSGAVGALPFAKRAGLCAKN